MKANKSHCFIYLSVKLYQDSTAEWLETNNTNVLQHIHNGTIKVFPKLKNANWQEQWFLLKKALEARKEMILNKILKDKISQSDKQ